MQHLPTKSAVSFQLAPQGSLSKRSSGFSLIEVLVSIIILSFGMLGMVGLQAAALQSNRDARLQSAAGNLAKELGEMMRGNVGISRLPAGAANPYLGQFNAPLVAANPQYCLNAGSPACINSTLLASAQMTEWLARVATELPGARVTVCVDSAPYNAAGVPQWVCNAAGVLPNIYIKIGWTRGSTDRTSTNANPLDFATTPSVIFPVTPGTTS
jgi:type IV pilus assembly protein PilV